MVKFTNPLRGGCSALAPESSAIEKIHPTVLAGSRESAQSISCQS